MKHFKKGDILKHSGDGVKAVWMLTADPILREDGWWVMHPTYGLVWAASCDYASADDALEEMTHIYAQYSHAAKEMTRIKKVLKRLVPDSLAKRFTEKTL